MSETHFEAEITRIPRVAANHGSVAATADRDAWNRAAESLGERVYRTDAGAVRVRAGWSPWSDELSIRLPLEVIDERTSADPRDLPAFVELFFHDVFLLFNIAVPGSFGGTIAVSGGEYRVNEIALHAHVFEAAWAAASRNGGPTVLPLAKVVAWYDSLGLGTEQVATSGVAKLLFQLLHLARGAEDEMMTLLRLPVSDERLVGMREAIASGTAPVIHPMHDDALDPRVGDTEWIEAADLAASIAVGELQALAGGRR